MGEDLTYYWLVSNVISLLFVMLTVSPYLIVRSLRESMHGKCVVSQQLGNIIAYFSTSVTQFLRYTYPFTPVSKDFHKYTCVIHGFIVQFVTLSTFTWMAVMTFDVWWVFSYPSTKKESKGKTGFRFKFYSLFAWGLPILILGLTWLMGYTGTTPVSFSFKPNAGHSMCFFQHSLTLWLFLYGPTAVLVMTNTVLLKLAGPLIHQQKEEEEEKKREKEKNDKDKKKKKKRKDEDEEEDQESLGSFPMDDEDQGDDGGDDSDEENSIPDQDRYYMYLKLFILNLGHLMLPIFYYPGCVWYIPVLDHTLYGIIAFLILVYNDTILDSIKPRKEGEDDGGGMFGGIEQVKVMGVGVTEAVDVAKTVKGEIENLPMKDAMESVKTIADDYNGRGVPEGQTFDGFTPLGGNNHLMAPPILGYPIPPIPPQVYANYAVPNKKPALNRSSPLTNHPSLDTERMPRSQFSLDEMKSLGNPHSGVPTISSTLEDVRLPPNYTAEHQHHQQQMPNYLAQPNNIQKPNSFPGPLTPKTPSTIESSPQTLKTIGVSSDEDA